MNNNYALPVSPEQRLKELEAQLEAELAMRRIAEARLGTVLDSVVDGVVTIDMNGTVKRYNKAAERLFGYPADEVIGKNVLQLIPHDMRSKHEQGLEQYRATGKATIIGKCVEVSAQHRSGKRVTVELTISRVDDNNESLLTSIIRDITERKEAEEKIRDMALQDPLTGLANRNLFNVHLERAIYRANRNRTDLALMYLDLDHFKPVNDEHGHEAGDAVLKVLANRFKCAIRTTDVVARIGGDEFVVVLEVINGRENASMLAERLIATASEPVHHNGKPCNLGVSIGIAMFPGDAKTAEELLNAADKAMYAAKRAWRNTHLFFDAIQG